MEPHERDVSLSEEEQRVLLEIEECLSRSDPTFAARLARGRPGRLSFWLAPAALLLLGAVVMLASVASSLAVAIAGAVVFAAGLALTLVRAAPVMHT